MIAWIFPGQGTQKQGMGQKFMDRPAFRQAVQACEDATGKLIRKYLQNYTDEVLQRTDRAQLSVFAMSMGIAACFQEKNLSPKITAGHSLGHLSALTVSGALELEQTAQLVCKRGKLMTESGKRQAGGMGVIQGLDAKTVAGLLSSTSLSVWLANLNLPDQTVVSGLATDLESVRKAVNRSGGWWLPLNVSGAFHSPLLAKEAARFAEIVADTKFRDARCPVLSNTSGLPLSDAEDIRADLSEHMTRPVAWTTVMDKLRDTLPDIIVEIGSGKTLTGFLLRQDRGLRIFNTGTPASCDRALHAVLANDNEAA